MLGGERDVYPNFTQALELSAEIGGEFACTLLSLARGAVWEYQRQLWDSSVPALLERDAATAAAAGVVLEARMLRESRANAVARAAAAVAELKNSRMSPAAVEAAEAVLRALAGELGEASAPKEASVAKKKGKLQEYVESFDQETLVQTANIVSAEAAVLVERQSTALFGSIQDLQAEMQADEEARAAVLAAGGEVEEDPPQGWGNMVGPFNTTGAATALAAVAPAGDGLRLTVDAETPRAVPRPLFPTNHWNAAVLGEGRVLNTLTGALNDVRIRAGARAEQGRRDGPRLSPKRRFPSDAADVSL